MISGCQANSNETCAKQYQIRSKNIDFITISNVQQYKVVAEGFIKIAIFPS